MIFIAVTAIVAAFALGACSYALYMDISAERLERRRERALAACQPLLHEPDIEIRLNGRTIGKTKRLDDAINLYVNGLRDADATVITTIKGVIE